MQHVALHYPTITHALVDLYVNKKNALVFQHVGLDFNDVWRQIISYGKSMFNSAFDLLQNVAWETLFTLKQVPNYLASLLRVIEQLLLQKSLSTTLYDAFYVGANKLWSLLVQLLPSSFQMDIGAQISAFGQALKTYGTAIWKAMQYLFSGFKKLIEALMVLYHRAVAKLAEFSGLFVASMSIFSPVKQRCTQTVIFSFMLMQNVLELGSIKSNQAIDYLKLHVERLSSETQLLHSLVERLNPTSKIMQVLLQNEILQNLLQYINSSAPLVIFRRIFKFIDAVIANVITSISSYITAFGLQAVHYMTNVLSKIMDLPEYHSIMNLTNAAQELSENQAVSAKNQEYLKEAVQVGMSFETEMTKAKQNKFDDLANLFENTWFAAKVISNYYHEVPVSQEDQDRVCKDATGFNTIDLLKTHGSVASLLQERISVVYSETFDQEKVKIEAPFIGLRGDDDENWLKEAFEKRQEIATIDERIQKLERQIGYLKDTDAYVSEMEIYQIKRRNAMQELSKADNQATRVYLSTLDALKANIEEANGIAELKREIELLKEQREALQRSISQKSGRSKQVSGIITVLVTAFVVGYIAIQIAEKQRRDVMVASQYTFNSLLSASNNDPILQAQVQRFIEQEGINFADATANTLNRFQKYVASVAFDIENKKIDLETTEKDWALFIASSIRMHENKKKEEEKSAINMFWSFVKGETKSTDVALIESGNAIEKTFDSAAVGLLKNVDMQNFHIGWTAYAGNSVAEKQDAYVADVANILKAHFTAMSGIFATEQKKYIQQANPGWLTQIATAISYGFKQTGVGGADRKATTDDMLDSLAFGGVGFIIQQFVYYEASLVFFVTSARILLFTITALVGAVVNVIMGEQDIAYTLLLNLGNEALRGLGIVGAHWIRAATTIMLNRFSIITLVLNVIMSALLIFTPAGILWSIVRGIKGGIVWTWNGLTNCRRVKQVGRAEDNRLTQEGRDAVRMAAYLNSVQKNYKVDAQICSTCSVEHAFAVCGHCLNTFYCSEGCAELHWPSHAK